MRPRLTLGLTLALTVGLVLGLGAFTFIYGKGFSYFQDEPAACVNCHIMRENYDSWSAAPHRGVTCNGCHVPAGTVGKYFSKARNGWLHSYAFTFRNVQVLRIRQSNQRVVDANCRTCHERLVSEVWPMGVRTGRFCFDCHRGAGHGF